MNEAWQEKLMAAGVPLDLQTNQSPGAQSIAGGQSVRPHSASRGPLLVDLSPVSVVDISGADAQEFLQGQVCNDLTVLRANEMQMNGYCNPKGRLLALFAVFAHDDGYRLLMPGDVAELFVKRLRMFVLRAQVTISVRNDLVCSGIEIEPGDTARVTELTHTAQAFPELTFPEEALFVSPNQHLQIVRWHDNVDFCSAEHTRMRFICIAEPDALLALWKNEVFQQAPWSYWRWADINAGVPSVFADSYEQFIPQMLNLQLLGALSFKKGCYPGQEIVARMQYLGKLKKHMKRFRVSGATQAPKPGATITTERNNNAGQVVDAILDEAGLNLLAVVNIDTLDAELELDGHALAEASMPYAIAAVANEKDT